MYSVSHQRKSKQVGAMLIMLAIFLVLASLALLVTQLNGRTLKNQRDQQTALALAEAKAALIGYAISYDDVHTTADALYGYLPCPNTKSEEVITQNNPEAEEVCGSTNINVLGRLPWKTLKLAPLRDGAGECLWYAVSGNFKEISKRTDMSPDFNGLFNILAANGNFIAGHEDPTRIDVERAVAVVFAPGAVLSGQDRSTDQNAERCGGNYAAANYLDADIITGQNNALISAEPSGISTFVAAENSQFTTDKNDSFNDQLLLIRPSEIFAAYCKKYTNTLLNLITETTNDCATVATPPVPPALPLPPVAKEVCTDADLYLENCTPCSNAASTLITAACMADMAALGCQAALTTLKGCNA